VTILSCGVGGVGWDGCFLHRTAAACSHIGKRVVFRRPPICPGDRNDQSAAPARIVPSLSMRVAHSRFHDRPTGTLHSAKDAGRGACLLCLSPDLLPYRDGLSPSETTLPGAMSQGAERYVKVIGECRGNHLKPWQLSSSHDGLAFAEGKRRSSVHTIHQESSYG